MLERRYLSEGLPPVPGPMLASVKAALQDRKLYLFAATMIFNKCAEFAGMSLTAQRRHLVHELLPDHH